jgi:hypothetical protein
VKKKSLQLGIIAWDRQREYDKSHPIRGKSGTTIGKITFVGCTILTTAECIFILS